jgi:hypothetical protein
MIEFYYKINKQKIDTKIKIKTNKNERQKTKFK